MPNPVTPIVVFPPLDLTPLLSQIHVHTIVSAILLTAIATIGFLLLEVAYKEVARAIDPPKPAQAGDEIRYKRELVTKPDGTSRWKYTKV